MAPYLLISMKAGNNRAHRMCRPTGAFFLMVVSALGYSACACAAIFDLDQPPSVVIKGDTGRLSGSHSPAGIAYTEASQFPSLHPRITNSQDLLWILLGDATRPTLYGPTLNGDKPLQLSNAGVPLLQNGKSAVPTGAPEERAAPGIWVMLLIGAGLIWSHMLSPSRSSGHGARRAVRPWEPRSASARRPYTFP
jgi:hypothetical protein